MEKVVHIKTPLDDEVVGALNAGDRVALSGPVYSARDMAHKRICEAIAQGQSPPFDLAGQVIYFVGPTPAQPGGVIGSAGPTTSSRMDPFSPILIERGLKGMVGKGYRGPEVVEALKKYKAVHFAAIGGAGALLSKHIVSAEIAAYEDLGTEAVRLLEFKDFPVVVAYDCAGNSVYDGVCG